jgi:hypothetical protein
MLEWENVAEEKNVKENKNQPVFFSTVSAEFPSWSD